MSDVGWWRRNRRAVLALPVAVALAVAASSSRVVLFWWPYGPHDVTRADAGELVAFSDDWQDRAGEHTRRWRVSVDAVDTPPTRTVPDEDGGEVLATVARTEDTGYSEDGEVHLVSPPGTRVWRVVLTVEADPDEVLRTCRLAVVDTRGRSFEYASRVADPVRWTLKTAPCVPADAPGPSARILDGQGPDPAEELDRPARYTTEAYVSTAADAVPAAVRVWFDHPETLEVTLPAAR